MDMKRDNVIMIVANICAAVFIAVSFIVFAHDNEKRVDEQTRSAAVQNADIVAVRMDETIMAGYDYIRMLSEAYSGSMTRPTVNLTDLHKLADNSIFDFIEFCDVDGYNHSVAGMTIDARDRKYYTDGMNGNTGMDVIYDTSSARDNMLFYYTPITYENETVGIMLGILKTSNRLNDIFRISYGDESAELYLCADDGRVIMSSGTDEKPMYVSEIAGDNSDLRAVLETALTGESNTDFDFEPLYPFASISGLKDCGWNILQLYPRTSYQSLINYANSSGAKMAAIIIGMFTAAFIVVIFVYNHEKKRLELVSNERGTFRHAVLSDAIIVLEVNLSKNIITDGLWKDESDNSVMLDQLLGLTLPCSYDVYINLWNKKFVNNDASKNFADLTDRKSLLESYNNGKTEITFDYQASSIDGNHKYYRRNIYLTRNDITGDINAYTSVKDITALVEKDMRQKEEIRSALVRAEAANKAKTVFLSNMSHDIRTPMNAIIGFTTLAETHMDNREALIGYLEKISASSKHLLSLINDVLDMSRIESGRMHLDEVECSLSDIMKDMRSILMSDLKAKNLTIQVDSLDVKDEHVICDKLRINQVLLNLLSNSVKYTEANGHIYMRVCEKPNTLPGYATYEFTLKDTGMGMKPEFLEHLFDPFERERNTTISGIQGTGLGMAITKSIVDMMKGTIKVTSQVGVGSEFIIDIPMRIAGTCSDELSIPEFKDAKALVVDDDFNTCESVSSMLNSLGLNADWTLNGFEAVTRAIQARDEGNDYRLYMVDWRMPDMNGIDLIKHLRSEFGPEVPIIVLSAYDWYDIEDEAKAAGVTAFCSKPLFRTDLHRCLTELNNRSAAADSKVIPAPDAISGKRVLLVEDNELNREIANDILSEAGLLVDNAENGRECVDTLIEKGAGYYDIVLMDIQMPVMDGYTATRTIRALDDKALARIPIVAMTANAFAEDKRNAAEAGMNAHVAKPISVDELLCTLERLI